MILVFKLDFGPVLKGSLLPDQAPELAHLLGGARLALLVEWLYLERPGLLGGVHAHGVQEVLCLRDGLLDAAGANTLAGDG